MRIEDIGKAAEYRDRLNVSKAMLARLEGGEKMTVTIGDAPAQGAIILTAAARQEFANRIARDLRGDIAAAAAALKEFGVDLPDEDRAR